MIKIKIEDSVMEYSNESIKQLFELLKKDFMFDTMCENIIYLESSEEDTYVIIKLFGNSILYTKKQKLNDTIPKDIQRWYGDTARNIFYGLSQLFKD